jgi:phosphatidylglycerophosphate synthase
MVVEVLIVVPVVKSSPLGDFLDNVADRALFGLRLKRAASYFLLGPLRGASFRQDFLLSVCICIFFSCLVAGLVLRRSERFGSVHLYIVIVGELLAEPLLEFES